MIAELLRNIIAAIDQGDGPDSKFPDRKGEYWALCPFHPDSHSGNFSFSEKGFKCFACGESGGLQALAARLGLDPGKGQGNKEERAAWQAEKERRQAEAKEKARSALENLQHKRPDLIYYSNLNGQAETVMSTWGLTQATVDLFKIGYCRACPTSPYTDSFTIPYYYHETVVNIRHRLIHPNGQGKYRPEAAGLPASIFNADLLAEKWVVLVEGEFKAMVLTQYGLPAVAIPGASAFKDDWGAQFSKVDKVHICLDWGAETQARRIGALVSRAGCDVWLVMLPIAKPDDFFVLYNGTVAQFCKYLESGRKV